MKLLLLLTLTSCALQMPERNTKKKEVTHNDKLETCLFRLVEKNGVEAKVAQEVCDKIYRRK